MHLHSELSNGVTNIDSVTKYDEYIKRAKELGMKAMAFTEHGNVFSWKNKKQHIEDAGMKYIHGIEAYVTESLNEKVRDNYHCVLLAKNYEGFLEINKLSSKSFNRNDGHYYYSPRITYDELENTSNNVIISTACLGGILSKGTDEIKDRFISFLSHNKHRCFLEIQHHAVADQIKYNQYLYELSKTIHVPLIAGTDTHALNKDHLEGRSILQKSKKVLFAGEEEWDLSFKTYDELIAAYEKQNSLPMDIVEQAIENTNVLADMVEEYTIDTSYKYPHLWEDPLGTFKGKIQQGIKRRGVDKYPNYQEYLDRIKYEMKAYVHNGAIDFMLLMEDIISWCRTQNIGVGYGRGSVNGSVIAWILGITEMDSIKHGLNFDRFMNVERVSLSDVDTDFPPSRIEEVKQYIFSKHGLYCSDIITFNTIADKGAIRDVGRALGIPLVEVSLICNSVDREEEYKKYRERYKELFRYVDIVKGTVVSIGSHPCGLIVSPVPLDDAVGLCTTSTSQYPISQIYMKEIDGLNYVKLDLLKLDTIEIINNTCELAGIERLTPDNVDITDVKVWNAIRDDTTQVFQWESATGQAYIKKLLSDENIKKFQSVNKNVDRMTLLSIGNSAIRPAGASYRDDLASGVIRKTGSKPIDDFLSNTFGYLVFQEQIISFLHLYCGFTMGEADVVRRGFAKKTGTDQYIPVIKNGGYLSDKSEHHINGYIETMQEKYGISEDKSEKDIVAFIQVIEDASSYLFSLNHSQPYSYEGYVSGYLRTYYPLEFLTTALNVNNDKEEKTKALTAYAKKVGITFRPPKFRYSRAGYFCDKETNSIYKGIGSIKYIDEKVSNELFRMSDMKFNDFVDVLYYLKTNTSLDARQLDILIKIDFFEEFGDINQLLYITEKFNMLFKKKEIQKNEQLEKIGVTEELIRPFSKTETDTRIDEIDCLAFAKYAGMPEEDLSDCIKYKKAESGDRIPNGYSSKKVFKKYQVTDEQKRMFATKTVIGRFSNINMKGLLKKILSISNIEKCTLSQKMKYQIEHLGYIEYVNPELSNRYIVILDLDTQYSPKFKAYCMQTGQMCEMKIHNKLVKKDKRIKTCFNDTPVENGDIVYMIRCDKEARKRKGENGWENVPGEFVWWINEYRKVNDEEVNADF